MKQVIAVLSLLLLLVACAPKTEVAPEPQITPPEPQPVVKTEPVATPEPADDIVTDLETSSQEVDQLDSEFDLSDLDELDAQLAELDTLEFE